GRDPDETIASGGEDYELLVTVPPSSETAALEAGFVRLGEIVAGSRVEVERVGGGRYEGPKGYGHAV
ncbi:MAG: thiamine-phosphate kinase, partial [Actinobacteria bacterium]|nr:thiamine-phosphate kinase [Actinomycetota bacterium]